MSEVKHTPGPWAVNEDGYKVESETEHGWVNDGWVICVLEGPDKKANARLIAAAPDLLSMLKVAQLWLDVDGRFDMQGINAAIAKAEGET